MHTVVSCCYSCRPLVCCSCPGADRIERLLSLGASRAEATRELLGRSVRLAMTPLLNQMSVVGLVSIPGMMTGQILGGSNPDQAARCAAADTTMQWHAIAGCCDGVRWFAESVAEAGWGEQWHRPAMAGWAEADC